MRTQPQRRLAKPANHKSNIIRIGDGARAISGVIARRMNGEPKEGRCATPCRANCTGGGKHRATAAIRLSF